jgi:hypothetical protein
MNYSNEVKEGIFKVVNGAYERLSQEQFILRESWKKTRDRLQAQDPRAKIRYSYKTKQFTITYDLPSDFELLTPNT